MDHYGPYVPSDILKKYIVMWMSYDSERTLDDVARATGVTTRTLHDIMYGKRATVRFNTADQLLLGLAFHMAWWQDAQLAEFYAAA